METLKRHITWLAHEHRDFIMLLILFTVFRAMTVLFFQPGGYFRGYSDFTLYMGAARVTDEGYYPFIDFWLEYPPLFPWLFTALYRLSLLLPLAEDPRLWFYTLLGFSLVVFEVGNFILIYAIALKLGTLRDALRRVVFYAMLFFPVYALTTDFDAIPLFFMLLGLYLILAGRAIGSGVAIGLGFCVKVTPIILIAVAVRAFNSLREKVKHIAAAAAAIIVLSIPFLFLSARLYLIPFRGAIGRSSWESIWAILEGYFSYGEVGGDRFDHAVTDFTIHASTLPWAWITVAFAVVYLFFYIRPVDYRDKKKVLGLSILTVALFVLYSKGYSPQFLVYLLPLIVLYCSPGRAIAYAIAFTVLNFLEQPIYFVVFPDQYDFFTGIVIFRTLLLIGLVIESALGLLPQGERIDQIWRRILAALLVVLAVWVTWSGVTLSRTFYQKEYQAEKYRPAIEYLKQQARSAPDSGVLFSDYEAYRRVYPFLHGDMALRVVNTGRPHWADDLREWIVDSPTFWLWRGDVTDPDLERWFDEHARLVTTQSFDWGSLFLLSLAK